MRFNDQNAVEGMSFAFLVAFLINGLAIAVGVNILYPTLAIGG